MDIFVILLLSLSLLLIGSLVTLSLLAFRVVRTWQLRMLRAQATSEIRHRQTITALTSALLAQAKETTKQQQLLVGLADKGMALAATTDPLAFQAVQAMETTPSPYDVFDPSDAGEAARIAHRNPNLQEDDLSGFEQGILGEFGIDPEFIVSRADQAGAD